MSFDHFWESPNYRYSQSNPFDLILKDLYEANKTKEETMVNKVTKEDKFTVISVGTKVDPLNSGREWFSSVEAAVKHASKIIAKNAKNGNYDTELAIVQALKIVRPVTETPIETEEL